MHHTLGVSAGRCCSELAGNDALLADDALSAEPRLARRDEDIGDSFDSCADRGSAKRADCGQDNGEQDSACQEGTQQSKDEFDCSNLAG